MASVAVACLALASAAHAQFFPGPTANPLQWEPRFPQGAIVVMTGFQVLSFSADGTHALVSERGVIQGTETVREVVHLVNASGAAASLLLADKNLALPGPRRDNVDRHACRRHLQQIESWMREYRFERVRTSMCGGQRRLVEPTHNVTADPTSAVNTPYFRAVGFTGLVFTPRRGPLVVVVGRDLIGHEHFGVATRT
jgi:hypothetical protein